MWAAQLTVMVSSAIAYHFKTSLNVLHRSHAAWSSEIFGFKDDDIHHCARLMKCDISVVGYKSKTCKRKKSEGDLILQCCQPHRHLKMGKKKKNLGGTWRCEQEGKKRVKRRALGIDEDKLWRWKSSYCWCLINTIHFFLTLYVVDYWFCIVICDGCLCYCDVCSLCHMCNFLDEIIKWSWIMNAKEKMGCSFCWTHVVSDHIMPTVHFILLLAKFCLGKKVTMKQLKLLKQHNYYQQTSKCQCSWSVVFKAWEYLGYIWCTVRANYLSL